MNPQSRSPIRLEYVFDEATLLAANHALWRRRRARPRTRLFGLALAAALPLSTWAMLRFGMYFTFLAVVAGNLLFWFFDWPLTRAVIRRRLADMPGLGRRFAWEIDENGLTVRGPDGEGGTIRWEGVEEAWEDDAGFVIVQPGNVSQWLPRDAFASAEDVAAFRDLLARRVRRAAAE